MTGGLNTLFTLAIYQLVVTFLSPSISYTIAWLVGFLFVLIAYPKFVFRSESLSIKKSISLLLFYLGSFLVGLLLTWSFVHWGLNERLTIFVVIAITSTINFIAGKFLYGNKRGAVKA